MDEFLTYKEIYEGLLADEYDVEIEYSYDNIDETRPPKQTPRQRKANAVKASATRELLGEESPVKNQIKMIFKAFDKLIKQHAKEQKTPITGINVDKITLKRKEK